MFSSDRLKKIAAEAQSAKDEKKKAWNTKSIKEKFDEVVIGNEGYKQVLSSVLAGYLSELKTRHHVIVFGPSGTGKTYMLEQTLPDLGIPYVVIDSSSLVPAGYSGNTLTESLKEFYKSNQTASDRGIIVLDEFDKISEKANGGDTHKSHSIQGELLTNIQGKKEGGIDTRNSLWIVLGAFAYADEMKQNPPEITKDDLKKYGFKNELLGRITMEAMTETPTVEQMLERIAFSKDMKSFFDQMKLDGFELQSDDFEDEALLELAMVASNPLYGMRAVPTVLAAIKQKVVFSGEMKPGEVRISGDLIRKIKSERNLG
ncbi:hypothetical protein BH10BDE1_BH10BDE1_16900 [soil metagenome]